MTPRLIRGGHRRNGKSPCTARQGEGWCGIDKQKYILLFKASALWADAFYKLKCLSVCPSVCPSVRLFTFEVPFNGFFAPTSRSQMSNIFRDSESLGKSNGKNWSNIWTFCLTKHGGNHVSRWIRDLWSKGVSLRGCRLEIIVDQYPCKSDLEPLFWKCFNADNFYFYADWRISNNIFHFVTFKKSKTTCSFNGNEASRLSYLTGLLTKLPGDHIPLL